MKELIEKLLADYGLMAIVGAVGVVAVLWIVAHLTAAPSGQVSILWGLVEYTKAGGGTPGLSTESITDRRDEELRARALSGDFTIGEGQGVAFSLEVTVHLLASSHVTLFQLSENPAFVNVDWQPMSEFVQFEFEEPGRKELFGRFSADDGRQTAVIAKTVDIQLPPRVDDVAVFLFDSRRKRVGLGLSWGYAHKNFEAGFDQHIIVANLAYPGYGTWSDVPEAEGAPVIEQWRYSIDGDITRAEWMDVSYEVWNGNQGEDGPNRIRRHHFPVALPEQEGEVVIRFQVKAAAGESNVFSRAFQAGAR